MNHLKKLSIEHYKWFFEEQSCEFWIPDWQGNWSGLTVITWPNNTGKTSIIEALLIQIREEGLGVPFGKEFKFSSAERHPWSNPKISIEYLNNELAQDSVVYTNISNWSQVRKQDKTKSHNILFEVIQSRRFWQAKTSNTYDERTFFGSTRYALPRNSSWVDTAAILKTINNDPTKKGIFNSLLKNIVNITWWTIDTDDDNQDFIVYTTWSWISHQAWLLWDWIISIFRICAQLINHDNTAVIIDEPELSLHPQAQKRLAKVLSEKAKDRQIIVCTHSPYFVNWDDFLNWAQFIRLNKYNDQKCTISQLNWDTNYSSLIGTLCYERQKPQLLDIAAKEIMFSENILFVEWQEDVWLIKKYINEENITLNFDIFWYWVWWYSNIKPFLEMSKDLWLEKVWVLYDNWLGTTIDNEELPNMYINYLFKKLSTNDIRDKYDKDENLIKEWIFDKHWVIKTNKKNEFKQIIHDFIDYFNELWTNLQ